MDHWCRPFRARCSASRFSASAGSKGRENRVVAAAIFCRTYPLDRIEQHLQFALNSLRYTRCVFVPSRPLQQPLRTSRRPVGHPNIVPCPYDLDEPHFRDRLSTPDCLTEGLVRLSRPVPGAIRAFTIHEPFPERLTGNPGRFSGRFAGHAGEDILEDYELNVWGEASRPSDVSVGIGELLRELRGDIGSDCSEIFAVERAWPASWGLGMLGSLLSGDVALARLSILTTTGVGVTTAAVVVVSRHRRWTSRI